MTDECSKRFLTGRAQCILSVLCQVSLSVPAIPNAILSV